MKNPPLVFNINGNPPSTFEIESRFSGADSSRRYALIGGAVLSLGSIFCYYMFLHPQPTPTLGATLAFFGVLLGPIIAYIYGHVTAGGFWLREHGDNERLDALRYQATLQPEIAQYIAKVEASRKLTIWEVDNLFFIANRSSTNPASSIEFQVL